MNDFYVYQLRLEESLLPFYIGKGRKGRAKAHLTKSSLKATSRKNSIIKSANAAGIAVLVEFISTGMTEEDAFDMERELVLRHGRLDNATGCLANHTDGGDGAAGCIHSEESNRKRSRALKGKIVSQETREKMSESQSGRVLAKETREKMSSWRLGRAQSEDAKQKQRETIAKRTPEQKAAYSAALRAGQARRRAMKDAACSNENHTLDALGQAGR